MYELKSVDGDVLACVFPSDLDENGNFEVPDNIKVIGERAFSKNVAHLINRVDLPFGLEIIRKGAFMNCYKMREIWLPPTIRTICDMAFEGCSELALVELCSGKIDYLGVSFRDCRKLSKIVALQPMFDAIKSQCHLHWDASETIKPSKVLNNKLVNV